METNFESRFIQVATSGVPCQMTNEELYVEFEIFQRDVRELLTADKGYLAIDFVLNDTLAQLEGVTCGKKK